MKSKTVTLTFEINENECPIVDVPTSSFASASFHPACPEHDRDQIIIEANRPGLYALGSWMVALADSDSNLDHQHFDNEIDMGFFKSKSDVELIIQRVGK